MSTLAQIILISIGLCSIVQHLFNQLESMKGDK